MEGSGSCVITDLYFDDHSISRNREMALSQWAPILLFALNRRLEFAQPLLLCRTARHFFDLRHETF